MSPVHYIPIVTTAFSAVFFYMLLKHWLRKTQNTYLLWWTIGVLAYGAGTLTESINTLAGVSEANLKAWYILGALLGGAPLAQGTVYLLMKKRVAHILTGLVVTAIVAGGISVLLSPVDMSALTDGRLKGEAFEWQWVRAFSPFINLYAVIFLIGGAIYSAIKYYQTELFSRFWGNLYIALGAILPGIGGSFTRFGHVEVLYVTELLGILLIFAGYWVIKKDSSSKSVHEAQQSRA